MALPAGLAVGVVLGLLGAGGSLMTVPALLFLLGMSTTDATGTSLVAVAMMAVAGVAVHQRAGRCRCREALGFGLAAALTAAVAGWLASALSDRILGGAFVVLLIGTAVWMARREEPESDDRPGRTYDVWSVGAGGGVGVLTGLLGVGGGSDRARPGGVSWTPDAPRRRHLPAHRADLHAGGSRRPSDR